MLGHQKSPDLRGGMPGELQNMSLGLRRRHLDTATK